MADRDPLLRAAAERLTDEDVWPYDITTAMRPLSLVGAKAWPPTRTARFAQGDHLPADLSGKVLILHGGRDLFCPVEWAYREAASAPGAELIVIPDRGHSIQAVPGEGRAAATRFLLA